MLELCLASALVPEGLLSDLLHVSNGETVDCPSDLLLLDVSVCKALYDSGSRPESLSFALNPSGSRTGLVVAVGRCSQAPHRAVGSCT